MRKALALHASDDLVDAHKRPNEIDVLAHQSSTSALENELKHSELMMSGAMHELVVHPELPDTRPQDIVEDGRDGAKKGREDIELLTRKLQSLEENQRGRSGEDDYVFPDPIPVPQELPRTPEKVGPSLKDRFKMAGSRLKLVGAMGIKRSPRPLHEAASMGDVFDMNELMGGSDEEDSDSDSDSDSEKEEGGPKGSSMASMFAKARQPGSSKHDPNERNSKMQTPMHFAACHGHEEAISALLHRGADMNLQDKQGQTPLHFAAAYGRENIVASLLRLPQCDPTIRDNSLQTPLHVAIRLQQSSISKLLREHPSGDAAARMRDVEGRLPASLAPTRHGRALAVECDGVVASLKNVARRGGGEVLRHLLTHDDAQFVIGWHDEVGRGLIHYAACHGRSELCRLLLDPQFTSVEQIVAIASGTDARGFTPLHYAASWGHTESMAVLLDAADADNAPAYADARQQGFAASTAAAARMVNARDTAGRTALHCAAMEGRDEAVALLLLRGASVSAEDFAGQTPEDVACNGKILKLLASVHKPPDAPPLDNIDMLAQSVAQHRAKYREAARGTVEPRVFPIEDDTDMQMHRTDRTGPMPMLVDGVEMLVSTKSDGYIGAVHKSQHAQNAKEAAPSLPVPPPPPGAPPPADEVVVLGRAIRNRHHHKMGPAHLLRPAAVDETDAVCLASQLDENFVHDATAAVARDIATHMDGEVLLQTVEDSLARKLRAAIAHRRKLYGHTIQDTRSTFQAMDRDGNGTLELPEFRAALNRLGLGLSHTDVEQFAHIMTTHRHTVVEYDGFVQAMHRRHSTTNTKSLLQSEPEPELEGGSDGPAGLAAAALFAGAGEMHKIQAKKAAARRAAMGPVEAARESKAEQWLRDAIKVQRRTLPRRSVRATPGPGVPRATARAAADGKDGRREPDAPKVRSSDLPRVHGLEISEIVSSCGLEEAGGDLYLQAFQVLVDNNLPKPGTGVQSRPKAYNPMDFW